MKKQMRIFKNENGQAAVIVGFMLVVIMGFAALGIDFGRFYVTKSNLQRAADAAALAGALDPLTLPANLAAKTAVTIANKNGMKPSITDMAFSGNTYTATNSGDIVKVMPTYNGNPSLIKVECTRTFPYTFGKVLGFTTVDITASAVAKKNWTGQSLPFINAMSDYATVTPTNLWQKVNSGYFEVMRDDEVEFSNLSFTIDYENGIHSANGTIAEGTDKTKTDLAAMWAAYSPGQKVYVFSFTDDAFTKHYVETDNGRRYFEESQKNISPYPKLGQGDNVLPGQLMLLECTWDSYIETGKNGKTLQITYTGVKYDLGNDGNNDIPENYSGPGGKPKLIE